MDRLLLLTLPSLVILGLLVAHSLAALPRRRAVQFWGAAAAFGLLRGMGVGLVTEDLLGGSMPYRLHGDSLSLFGVALQEVAGWSLVIYLAWWMGHCLACRSDSTNASSNDQGGPLYLQAAWGCVVLAAASWAVEATAVAAGWWSWTLPAGPASLHVPTVGLMDWSLVGVDFLLPFLLLTAPGVESRWRYASLTLFPLHLAAHFLLQPLHPALPLKIVHLWHWAILALITGLALRSRIRHRAFILRQSTRASLLPVAAAALLLADLALAQIMNGETARWPALLPFLAATALSVRPLWGLLAAGVSTLLAAVLPLSLAGALTALVGQALKAGRRLPRWAALAAAVTVGIAGTGLEIRAALEQQAYTRDLTLALEQRDGGELAAAERSLAALAGRHTGEHAVRGFLGELYYRTRRPDAARRTLLEAVKIKPDFILARRYLAVMALQAGRPADATAQVNAGLSMVPQDPELLYLQERARSGRYRDVPPGEADHLEARILAAGPEATLAVAGLAFELDDTAWARRLAAAGLARWPGHQALTQAGARLGLTPQSP